MCGCFSVKTVQLLTEPPGARVQLAMENTDKFLFTVPPYEPYHDIGNTPCWVEITCARYVAWDRFYKFRFIKPGFGTEERVYRFDLLPECLRIRLEPSQ